MPMTARVRSSQLGLLSTPAMTDDAQISQAVSRHTFLWPINLFYCGLNLRSVIIFRCFSLAPSNLSLNSCNFSSLPSFTWNL